MHINQSHEDQIGFQKYKILGDIKKQKEGERPSKERAGTKEKETSWKIETERGKKCERNVRQREKEREDGLSTNEKRMMIGG